VTVTSDHEGKFTTVIRVATGLPAQVAILKVTDVATGAYVFRTFTISTTPATGAPGTITVIPATVTLAGPNGQTCGFGTVDVLVFDGKAPYTAVCPNPQIQVVNSPTPAGVEPGRITLNVGGGSLGNCLTDEQCVVTDANGSRTTFGVTTTVGAQPAPPALTVNPAAITLTCGASGAVTVVGGSGSYSTNSTSARVTASASGNTVSITLNAIDPPTLPGPNPTSVTVTVTDGSTIQPITVTVPATCP
jgi:hypothetical protein